MAGVADGATAASPPAERTFPRLRAGWRVVAAKEMSDHLSSVRLTVLLLILGLVATLTVYSASGVIRNVAPGTGDVPALFLRLFTVTSDRVPDFFSTVGLVAFLAPLLGIAFGFDAVNGERSQGTLPRLVAQPIHRDDVINGKFASGLGVIGLTITSLMLVVAGLGLVRLGIVPSASDAGRMIAWFLVTMIYVAFWLGFSVLCSVSLRRAATSALVAIAVWLVLALFWTPVIDLVADVLSPVPENPTVQEVVDNVRREEWLGRLSPTRLYDEATAALLQPEVRTLSFTLPQPGAIPSTLSLDQSLLVAWPQIVGLVAVTVACFAVAYVLFMRQEIRA